jgi:hypothetical protein
MSLIPATLGISENVEVLAMVEDLLLIALREGIYRWRDFEII